MGRFLPESAFKEGRLNELNAIVHPAVIEAQRRWMDEVFKRDPEAIAVVESALIFEVERDARARELRDTRAQELIDQLRMPGEKTPAERALLIHVEGFDWNCPQHITPRYTQDELAELLAPMRQRMQELERENERLRSLEK